MRRQSTYLFVALFFCATVSLVNNVAEANKWKMAPKTKGSESTVGGWKTKGASVDLAQAKNNYDLHCASCHGENGDGKGVLAGELNVPPRDHTDAEYMSSRTDEQLLATIIEGGGVTGFDESMPPFSTVITKEEIADLVKYLRKLCECSYNKK